ncbi:MAG: YcaO-like family protein [Candidatus Nanopelagicales bacterium]
MVPGVGLEADATSAATKSRPIAWDQLCTPAESNEAGRVIADPGSALRTSTPDAVMSRVEPYLPDYGITRVAHLTHLDHVGIPVHTAHKPAGKSLSNGSGKGVTPQASRTSAIMEAVEQTYWEDSPITRIWATQDDLERDGVAHVPGDRVAMIRGNLWHPGLPIQWTPMTDVSDGCEVLVPADLVGLPWRVGSRTVALTHMCGSNGLASGNNVIEAILSGLTEVMERDAVAMWAAGSDAHLPSEALDPDLMGARFGEPLVTLLDKIRAARLELSVFDFTGELGLPTYKALLTEPGVSGVGSYSGYGASLDPGIALVRAVTEAVQARGLIIAGARDDQFRCGRDASRLTSQHSWVHRADQSLDPVARPNLSTGALTTDVEQLITMLGDAGLPQVLVHRYTEPGDPAQVVRVVVPELEGYMFANYTPGIRAARLIAARTGGLR